MSVAVELRRPPTAQQLIKQLDIKTPEGTLVGKPLVLLPFQEDIISRSFFRRATRRAIISIARKNGKTALCALIAIFALLGFRVKPNSFIAVAARSRDQASILFAYMAKMIRMSSVLINMMHIRDSRREIVCPTTGIVLRCLSADATTAYGHSPAMIIHDELGQVKGPRDPLYDALETATGAHDDALSIIISTQAPTDADLLSLLIDESLREQDPRTQLFLHAADPTDDIYDPMTWKKANPALGVFRSLKEFEEAAQRAVSLPTSEAAFRNLYLNQRIEIRGSFITPRLWKMNGEDPDLEVFIKNPTFAGFDLSARNDLTAFVMAAMDENDNVHVLPLFWTPGGTMRDRGLRDRAPYAEWVEQGFLRASPGNSINYEYVAQDLQSLLESVQPDLNVIAFDRWRINDFRRACDNVSFSPPLEEFGQGYKDMSPAVEYLEGLCLDHRLRHGNHPVLTWCMSNAVVMSDPAGNRKIDKHKATGRVDGVIALLMAVGAMAKNASGYGSFNILSLG